MNDWADLVIIGGMFALLVGGLLWLRRGGSPAETTEGER